MVTLRHEQKSWDTNRLRGAVCPGDSKIFETFLFCDCQDYLISRNI